MLQVLKISHPLNSLIKELHYDVLLMHLIKKCHGLKGVLNLLHEKQTGSLKCLESIQKELMVCATYIHTMQNTYVYTYIPYCNVPYHTIHTYLKTGVLIVIIYCYAIHIHATCSDLSPHHPRYTQQQFLAGMKPCQTMAFLHEALC